KSSMGKILEYLLATTEPWPAIARNEKHPANALAAHLSGVSRGGMSLTSTSLKTFFPEAAAVKSESSKAAFALAGETGESLSLSDGQLTGLLRRLTSKSINDPNDMIPYQVSDWGAVADRAMGTLDPSGSYF